MWEFSGLECLCKMGKFFQIKKGSGKENLCSKHQQIFKPEASISEGQRPQENTSLDGTQELKVLDVYRVNL